MVVVTKAQLKAVTTRSSKFTRPNGSHVGWTGEEPEEVKLMPRRLCVQIAKEPTPLERPRLARLNKTKREKDGALVVAGVFDDELEIVRGGELDRGLNMRHCLHIRG